MSILTSNKLILNLDMVIISNTKKRGLLSKKTIVYVNSFLFFCSKKYKLQARDVKYEIDGILNEAWNFVYGKQYKQAEALFDRILELSDCSCQTYFGKFIVSLFQDKDSYIYLKKAIETKKDDKDDDYYRLFLNLFNELLDLEEDYVPLLESLAQPQKVMAFSKNSYNGRYLIFLDYINSKQYDKAKEALEYCLEMKQNIYMNIIDKLLNLVIKHKYELKKARERQELELEKKRSIAFAQAVKNKDIIEAKKVLETIISYRNLDNKNNYIYYLFLELIETIGMVELDSLFELMPVTYNYTDIKDNFYTFNEAISAGDFKTALEAGRKCRGKLLDHKQNSIKVNLYVILLEILYEKLEERKNNIDNLYSLIINNIEKKNYKHALALYNDNSIVLKDYNSKLINYLLLWLSEEPIQYVIEPSVDEEVEEEKIIEEAEENLEEKIIEPNDQSTNSEEVIEVDEQPTYEETVVEEILSTEEAEMVEVENIKEDTSTDENIETEFVDDVLLEPADSPNSIKIDSNVNSNPVIFLRHNEPNHEAFQKYLLCLVNKKYEESKVWLDHFNEILEENNIHKRLDYYYYQINLGLREDKHDQGYINSKRQTYFLAYNDILNGNYDEAEAYLKYYNDLDEDNDVRGYLLLGRLYMLTNRYDLALETYINANSIAPNPDSYYFLGEIYYERNKWADAIFCYLTYNKFYPKENSNVYLNLSECYKHIEQYDKMVKSLQVAEEINVEQKRGLNLKERILKAEMLEKKKKEKFRLSKKNKGKNE